MSEWSKKLDAYIAKTKLSKKQLALKLGISINTLGKWWRSREPSAEHANRIRNLLDEGVSIQKQQERQEERAVIVSILRTTCPFCEKAIENFRSCAYCGQDFVWANVPVKEL